MPGQQQDKIAFITGGNRGLGREAARQLGALGATVVIGVRDSAKGEEAVAALQAEGADAHFIAADIATEEGRATIRHELESRFGRLDILINNAGVMLEGMGGNTTLTVDPQVLRDTMDVNFFTPVALTRDLLPLLRTSAAARIVNLSSVLGSLTLHADPKSPIYEAKAFAYDASKTALNAFTVHLAHELRDTPIKVNSAHPGWVQTDMGGAGADLDLETGGRTSVELATLPEDGPTGGFFHLEQRLPW